MGSSAILLTMVKDTCTTCVMQGLSAREHSDTVEFIDPQHDEEPRRSKHDEHGIQHLERRRLLHFSGITAGSQGSSRRFIALRCGVSVLGGTPEGRPCSCSNDGSD